MKYVFQVEFDIFNQREAHHWRQVMDWFNKEVDEIEREAKSFIDDSFQSLRSAEGAFDMLLNFKHIRSREAINNQMMQKFKDILTQYEKEVCSLFLLIINQDTLWLLQICVLMYFLSSCHFN